MSVTQKALFHLQDFIDNFNLEYLLFRSLSIFNRRFHSALLSRFLHGDRWTSIYWRAEKFLVPYMLPKHKGYFVDVGANLGLWSKFMAEKGVGVLAFDPSPRSIEALTLLSKQHLGFQVYPYALGETEKTAELKLHQSCGHDSLVKEANDFTASTVTVEVRTLDSFCLTNVGLIKIDTEGYETQVLKGAKDTITRNKPRLVIEVHKPVVNQLTEIKMLLETFGYKVLVKRKRQLVNPQPYVIADYAGDGDNE